MTVSLHGKYFKVLTKFSQFARFLSSNTEKGGTLNIFMLTEQNTNIQESQGNLTAMHSFNCCFIPIDQTKRPAFTTCIIHCSCDKSRLISPILKKDLDSLKYLL